MQLLLKLQVRTQQVSGIGILNRRTRRRVTRSGKQIALGKEGCQSSHETEHRESAEMFLLIGKDLLAHAAPVVAAYKCSQGMSSQRGEVQLIFFGQVEQ